MGMIFVLAAIMTIKAQLFIDEYKDTAEYMFFN